MKFIRLRPAGVQVPRVTFVNSERHKIVFQGAIHVGSPDFYSRVKRLIEAFDGEVHFEGIKPSEDNKSEVQMKALSMSYSLLANTAALSDQRELFSKEFILSNPEKYKNYDVESNVLDSFLTSADFQNAIEGSAKMNSNPKTTNRAKFFLRSPLMSFIMSASSNLDKSGLDKSIMLDLRNEVAVEKALEADKDVFMFWGAAHFPGIAALLESAGYIAANTQWDTVIPTFKREDKGINRDIEIAVANANISKLIKSPEWTSIF